MIIKEPVWKNRSVSVAKTKVPCVVEIAYRDKAGNVVFPHKYFLSTETAVTKGISTSAGGTPCWNVRIDDLEIMEFRNRKDD
jgi:hypothetical protein